MTAYLYNAPAGIKGSVSRFNDSIVEPIELGTPTATAFGIPVKISSGKAIPFAGGEVAGDLYGVLVREVPRQSSLSDADAPLAGQVTGVAVSGYVNVACGFGTPVRGGAVYARIVTVGPRVIGDFEASADGINSILLPNVFWATEGRDTANGNIAEIRIK
jgi:hypothetical protein